MTELTEYQKTLRELYFTNGRQGLQQYFHDHEGLSNEDTETKIDEVLPIIAPTEEPTDGGIQTVTVTFADGSTKEVQVAPNGVVVSPELYVQEPLNLDTMIEDNELTAVGNTTPKKSFMDKVKGAFGL